MNYDEIRAQLEKRGYQVSCFATAKEAADYLNREIDGVSVGFGGSVTAEDMGLYESLGTHNQVVSHWHPAEGTTADEMRMQAMTTDVYICSSNALSKTGELVNIDGTGNRLASLLFGHKKVYYVIGKNKLADTLEDAIFRARNVASPKNALRLKRKTPCAVTGSCQDCKSPDRMCRGMLILWEKMTSCEAEVVLIDEELGY